MLKFVGYTFSLMFDERGNKENQMNDYGKENLSVFLSNMKNCLSVVFTCLKSAKKCVFVR